MKTGASTASRAPERRCELSLKQGQFGCFFTQCRALGRKACAARLIENVTTFRNTELVAQARPGKFAMLELAACKTLATSGAALECRQAQTLHFASLNDTFTLILLLPEHRRVAAAIAVQQTTGYKRPSARRAQASHSLKNLKKCTALSCAASKRRRRAAPSRCCEWAACLSTSTTP